MITFFVKNTVRGEGTKKKILTIKMCVLNGLLLNIKYRKRMKKMIVFLCRNTFSLQLKNMQEGLYVVTV